MRGHWGLSRLAVSGVVACSICACGGSSAEPAGDAGRGGDVAGSPAATGGAGAPAAVGGRGASAGAGAGAGGLGGAMMAAAGSGGKSAPPYSGAGHSAAGSGGKPAVVSASAQKTFPVGLAIGSPVAVVQSASHASLAPRPGLLRRARDIGRAAHAALRQGDLTRLLRVGGELLPVSKASAAPSDQLELKALAGAVEQALAAGPGDALDLMRFFGSSGNANCYGPSMSYRTHQDESGGMSSGQLPGGDLGLWLEREGPAQPCVAAQLNRRIEGVKGQAQQGLLLMAALRRQVEMSSSLSLPAAGSSTDVTAELETSLHMSPKAATLDVLSATIALDADGKVYTYRFAFDLGGTGAAARSGEVVLRHKPGATATEYSGVLQIAGFSLSMDQARGCADEKDGATGQYEIADVSSVRYGRSGQTLSFSSRSGNYCGHPSSAAAVSFASEVATFDSDGELDPTVKLMPPMPPMGGGGGGPAAFMRAGVKGWIGNFSRFAGDFDLDTVEGDFLYAWQAGTQDNATRMLALDTQYDSALGDRSLQGFFGFGADIASSDGKLQGLICNWAGPGNNHTPKPLFQSQTATMAAGAMDFVIPSGGSKIRYAPTNSCSSTTTGFDADVDHTIEAMEGEGVTADLDAPSGSKTVAEELTARGFALPTLF